jgi:uncharacterized membrane protein YidH (DUF202 family)
MTEAKAMGSRGAAVVLVVAGLLTAFLSFQRWTSCPTTPCGGFLQAISDYSGTDLGFGVVTGLAGVLLAAIGPDGLRHDGVSRFATAAVLLALLIVVTVVASVVWMYVIPGDDKEFYRPPYTAILIGSIGLVALVVSLSLRRILLRRGG